MANWKKTIACTLASSCACFVVANPSLISGQDNNQFLPGSPRVADAFSRDSLPFATPYRPRTSTFELDPNSFEPKLDINDGAAPLPSRIPESASMFKPQAAGPSPQPSQASTVDESFRVANSSAATTPTVIVRPPASPTTHFNDLSVEVNQLVEGQEGEFGVRVLVPDSVKVVELLPLNESGTRRNFKIRMERSSDSSPQTSSSLANQLPNDGLISTGLDTPNSSRSFSLPSTPASGTSQTPVDPAGFKRNPFFGRQGSNSKDKTTEFKPHRPLPLVTSGHHVKNLMAGQPISSLASYRTTSNDFVPDPNAGETNAEPKITGEFSSLVEGPRMMGLGNTGDFVVYISNMDSKAKHDIDVKLDLPAGLDVVVLDRAAEIDQAKGTLTWNIPTVEPGQEHLIRYRVKSLAKGVQQQRITVSTETNRYMNEFDTDVLPGFDNAEAPLLPYESE